MSFFKIEGGLKLQGEVHPQGAKKRSTSSDLCRIIDFRKGGYF